MEINFMLLIFSLVSTLAISGSISKNEVGMEDESVAKLEQPEESQIMLPIRIEGGKQKKSTGDLLRRIGMAKIKNPTNHHRKRLASQSRKSHSGDSHMYIIKLPHNPYYYDTKQKKVQLSHNVNRIPVNFESNGKPGKIYHWNLPEVRKMVAKKANNKSKQINLSFKPSIWVGDEPYGRVSYYKPKKPSKQAFQKYFPGNGKPNSLYIIETKKHTSSFQRINK